MSHSTEEFDDVVCERETDKAIMVVFDREHPKRRRNVWVPKTVVDDDSEVFNARSDGCGPGKLVVARWFAEKEGLG